MFRCESLSSLFALMLLVLVAGCSITTHHAMIVEDDWTVILALRLEPDEFLGVSEQTVKDFADRIKLLMPTMSPEPTADGLQLRFHTEEFIPIDELDFVTRTEEGDYVKIEINLPPLITARDWSGEPTGPKMTFDLYVPGRVVEANTLDWEDNYEMRLVLPGKKKRVISELTERHLTRPQRLWVVVEPFE